MNRIPADYDHTTFITLYTHYGSFSIIYVALLEKYCGNILPIIDC